MKKISIDIFNFKDKHEEMQFKADIIQINLINKIITEMDNKNITKDGLAKLLNIDSYYLNQIFAISKPISIKMIAKIQDALNIRVKINIESNDDKINIKSKGNKMIDKLKEISKKIDKRENEIYKLKQESNEICHLNTDINIYEWYGLQNVKYNYNTVGFVNVYDSADAAIFNRWFKSKEFNMNARYTIYDLLDMIFSDITFDIHNGTDCQYNGCFDEIKKINFDKTDNELILKELMSYGYFKFTPIFNTIVKRNIGTFKYVY